MFKKFVKELESNPWFLFTVIFNALLIIMLAFEIGKKSEASIWTIGDWIKGIFFLSGLFVIAFKSGERSSLNKYR